MGDYMNTIKLLLCAALLFSAGDAFGAPKSSGGFSSGGSVSRPSSGGFSSGNTSKPSSGTSSFSAPPPASKPNPPSSGGFSAPTSTPSTSSSGGFSSKPYTAPSATPAGPPKSAYDVQVNRKMSGDAFKQRQASVDSARTSPVYTRYTGGRTYTPDQISSSRRVYYESHVYYHPVYYGHPYGMFAEAFMWNMMYNAAFGYNHYNDPAWQQWYADAQQRAQTDIQVRDQLAKLNIEIAQLKANGGGTPDPNYIPPDTPPEAAFDEDVLTAHVNGEVASGHGFLYWFVMAWCIMGILGLIWFVFRPRHRSRYA